MKSGTKLFSGHNADNSTTGRPSVGEILTTYTKEIGGKLRTIAIACMDKVNAVKYDVCSVEANIYESGGLVGDIISVTGLAVGMSATDQPAFQNATRMAMVQAFTSTEERTKTKSGEDKMEPITLEDLMRAPIGLVRQAVEARQMYVNQLFDVSALENDREFGPLIKESAQLKLELEAKDKALEEAKEKLTSTSRQVAEVTAKDLLDKLMPDNLTPSQKKFIEKRFKASDLEEVNEDNINKFIETEKEEYTEMAGIFGGSDDDDEGNSNSSSSKDTEDVTLDDVFSKLD